MTPSRSGQEHPDRPSVAVTADIVVLTVRSGALMVLLVQRANPPYQGCWALPGGFVEPGEPLEQAALRELAEEAGLEGFPGHLEQLRSYGAPGGDPRMRVISVAHLGLLPDLPVPTGGSDAATARFWPLTELLAADGPALAFDHPDIIAEGIERARAKLEYTPLATAFVKEPFTLGQLRAIYEAVWGTSVHAGEFRRQVLSTDRFVTPIEQVTRGGMQGGHSADLYRRGPATLVHPAILRPGVSRP